MSTFHAPTVPATLADRLNSCAMAIGKRPPCADGSTNIGHTICVGWNDFRGYYLAHYTWDGLHRFGRGDARTSIAAALAVHAKNGPGGSLRVSLRDQDDAAAIELGLIPGPPPPSHEPAWWDDEIGGATRHGIAWMLLQAESLEDYNAMRSDYWAGKPVPVRKKEA
jgi:hypothetical protein